MLRNSLLSLGAILVLAALNWWLGRSARISRDPGPAIARLGLDLIDFDEREGESANAGRAYVALGATATDLAAAVVVGDGWVTRRFGPGSLSRVNRDGARVQLRTRDFTLPEVALEFLTAERAACWAGRFGALATVAALQTGASEPGSNGTALEQNP